MSTEARQPLGAGAAEPGGAGPWSTRRLLAWIAPLYLHDHGVDSPRVVAEMLLAHVFGCERIRLYMEIDRPAGRPELERLRALVGRAARHEPVQYLVGEASFYLRSFAVDGSTLIPQPCTETLVDRVLAWARRQPPPLRVADIGTGCGNIAVTLAARCSGLTVVATDVVPDALELARRNARRHGVADRIELRLGPGLAPLRDAAPLDALCSNPPYIPDAELDQMDRCVREHVPRSAWYGGPDGLETVRQIVREAGEVLRPGGLLAMEIGHGQRDAALELAAAAPGLGPAEVLRDQEGFWRVLAAERE